VAVIAGTVRVTIDLRRPRVYIDPAPGRPPTQQPPAECAQCPTQLSKYRPAGETLCTLCRTNATTHELFTRPTCPGCGRDDAYLHDEGLCAYCHFDQQGRVAVQCDRCDRWFGDPSRGSQTHRSSCSSCRERDRIARMTPSEKAAWLDRKAQQRSARKRRKAA
jgi:hypothetical protein